MREYDPDETVGYGQWVEEPPVSKGDKFCVKLRMPEKLTTDEVEELLSYELLDNLYSAEAKEWTDATNERWWLAFKKVDETETPENKFVLYFGYDKEEEMDKEELKDQIENSLKTNWDFGELKNKVGFMMEVYNIKLFPWERPIKGKKFPIPAKVFKKFLKIKEKEE